VAPSEDGPRKLGATGAVDPLLAERAALLCADAAIVAATAAPPMDIAAPMASGQQGVADPDLASDEPEGMEGSCNDSPRPWTPLVFNLDQLCGWTATLQDSALTSCCPKRLDGRPESAIALETRPTALRSLAP